MNAREFYAHALTLGEHGHLYVGSVQGIVNGLLGELRAALYSLDGYECTCEPHFEDVNGVPVEELRRDMLESEVDTSGCVFHDPDAQRGLVITRACDILNLWEATSRPGGQLSAEQPEGGEG